MPPCLTKNICISVLCFQDYLKTRNTETEAIADEVIRYRDERKKKKEDIQEVQEAIQRAKTKRPADDTGFESNPENSDMEDEEMNSTVKGRGRGRGRGGRGSRGGRGGGETSTRGSRGGRGKGSKKAPVVESQSSIVSAFASQTSFRPSKNSGSR